jgi:D-sedoheptulose 7-phosphate isomerase
MSLRTTLLETSSLLAMLADSPLPEAAEAAAAAIADALRADRCLLVCGNGGSMADAQHIAGELAARFLVERRGLKAIALGSNTATLTAWSNDYAYDSAFAREVEALGEAGGVLLALSTSGNSANVVQAAEAARAKGMAVVALTGRGGGRLAALADHLLAVPSSDTPRIQEAHTVLYHYICETVEAACA